MYYNGSSSTVAKQSRTSLITYDFKNLIATVITRPVALGTSPEASSSLRVQGRPMNSELRKKLRRRISLDVYSALARRELKTSTWIIDLSEYGKFDPRENMIKFTYVHLHYTNHYVQELTFFPAFSTSRA